MDREYDPGNANLKKHCILQALLLVIIRFCPIYLLRYWPLFWVYLSTANWICLPCVFFSPAAIKISCVHSSWRFCLRKKSVANARRNDELSFPLPPTLSWHFLEFFFVSPSSKKNRQQGSPLFSSHWALLFRFRWPSTLLPCDWLDLRLFWIIACIVYIKLKGAERSLRPDFHLTEWQLTALFSIPFRQYQFQYQ